MRDTFHSELDELRDRLVETADVCDGMLQEALVALVSPGAPGADAVIERDQVVDRAYDEIQQGVLRLIALQAPVAGDLRLLAGMLHVNIHIERLGDYATSIAKMANLSSDLVDDTALALQLDEMGSWARHVARESIRSFVDGDVHLAERLPTLDDRVDDLNLSIFRRLVHLASVDENRLEWATHMIVIARSLERYGDHAVDIGEQTIFVATGEMTELSSNAPQEA